MSASISVPLNNCAATRLLTLSPTASLFRIRSLRVTMISIVNDLAAVAEEKNCKLDRVSESDLVLAFNNLSRPSNIPFTIHERTYPNEWHIDIRDVKCEYHHEPGFDWESSIIHEQARIVLCRTLITDVSDIITPIINGLLCTFVKSNRVTDCSVWGVVATSSEERNNALLQSPWSIQSNMNLVWPAPKVLTTSDPFLATEIPKRLEPLGISPALKVEYKPTMLLSMGRS